MSMYSEWKTDPDLERNGTICETGSVRMLLARAGGANREFESARTRLLTLRRTQIKNNTYTDTEFKMDLIPIYAKTIVKGWWSFVFDEWQEGIEPPPETGVEDGNLLPVTYENICMTYRNLPVLFDDAIEYSGAFSHYLCSLREELAKNLLRSSSTT